MKIYLGLTVFIIHISIGFSYVGYELFPGFNFNVETTTIAEEPEGLRSTTHALDSFNETTLVSNHTSSIIRSISTNDALPQNSITTTKSTTLSSTTMSPSTRAYDAKPIKYKKFNCSEDEKPFNIGSYEVPTQRDLVLLIRKTLIKSFNSYQHKAMYFLKDIHEATQATSLVADKCRVYGGDHVHYKKCVKQVSVKSQVITKSLVSSLEQQRLDVDAFIQGTICQVKEMKADPVQLLKTLAMEEASLEFALPGFLRLLGACTVYCNRTKPINNRLRPLRHMTDQDLVVKHFLTKKNYIQLLKDSN